MRFTLAAFVASVCCAPAIGNCAELQRICISDDKRGFVLVPSGKPFVPWGFNYDHDEEGRLLEDYWDKEWPKVEEDFREMKALGANVVRIHLQTAKFLKSKTEPNQDALDRLGKLLELAETVGLYLDLTGLGCYHKQDVPEWYDALGEEDRWAAQAVFWEAVALRCAKSPAVFCYDLMNEPVVPGGKRKEGDWLGPPFAGKHFVQVITLDQGERPRPEIARKWISHLAAAIRRLDKEHLVTVGMVDWSLDRPGLTSGFVPERVSADLDFLCVHIYPRSGKLDDALATLKGFAIGKPVVIEEMFPLSCTAAELDDFLNRAQEHVAGGIGFYWGKTPEEYRKGGTIGDAIVLAWLELFQKRAKNVPPLPDGEAPKDKQTAVNSLNMKLVLIPAGEFQMGASDDDADAEDHERPRHRVRIARPFYLATHETTVGAFRKFVDATGYKTTAETDGKGSSGYDEQTRGFVYGRPGYTWKSLGWRQEDDHPVLNVSWHDAVAFCQWLSEKEGQRYRLPTEAEWEYACRAGTTTRFFSGDRLEDVRGVANVLDESLIARWEAAARDLNEGKPHRYNVPVAWDDGFAFTAPVGSFKANPLGLYDVHGNVWEWCSDWYDKDYYKTSPADDPPGAKEGKGRVTRGGAFLSSPKVSRSSMRNSGFPDYHNYVIGFRVVREVGE